MWEVWNPNAPKLHDITHVASERLRFSSKDIIIHISALFGPGICRGPAAPTTHYRRNGSARDGSRRSLHGMAVATRNLWDFGNMGVDVISNPWAAQ